MFGNAEWGGAAALMRARLCLGGHNPAINKRRIQMAKASNSLVKSAAAPLRRLSSAITEQTPMSTRSGRRKISPHALRAIRQRVRQPRRRE